jgi:plasmid maintenance system antidote protein VapI
MGVEGNTMPMKNPPHPGDFIKTEIVDVYGLAFSTEFSDCW